MEPMTRRTFAVTTAKTAGALAFASVLGMGGGLPETVLASGSNFLGSNAQGKGKKILIAYESMFGSTSEVAQAMADVLCQKGVSVDVRQMKTVTSPEGYDGAILGSAVRSASWLPGAVDFAQKHQDTLSRIPVAYFLTCLALYHETPEAGQTALSYFDPVLMAAPKIKPRSVQAFAGKLDYAPMNFIMQQIMKSKMKKKGVPEGDHRDFEKISAWTRTRAWEVLSST